MGICICLEFCFMISSRQSIGDVLSQLSLPYTDHTMNSRLNAQYLHFSRILSKSWSPLDHYSLYSHFKMTASWGNRVYLYVCLHSKV
uniref:Uncharacterized protein n=1 Tax=Pyxicephalus adspersus TaxID=30357 RepID=A0AAV3AS30_PYXAD|nr:TPA: hypothetical protein GDO54_008561 [Pyxicephalus adspersus]